MKKRNSRPTKVNTVKISTSKFRASVPINYSVKLRESITKISFPKTLAGSDYTRGLLIEWFIKWA